MVPLPMPRVGVLMTRRSEIESSGFWMTFRVRDHVFDLGALVEGESADHFVLESVAAHGFFEQARLRIRAVEHGGARSFAVLGRLSQIFCDVVSGKERFVFAVWSLVVAYLGATLARSPEVLAFTADVVCDHSRRRLQNILRGAVVLFEADDLGFGKIFFEFEDVADVGSAPGVNRLVFIADSADVVALARQHPHEFVLRAVGVLIFVDEQILEAPVVVVAHVRGGFQEPCGFQKKIIEVESVGLAQLLAVFLEQMRDLLGLGIGRLQVKLLGIEHVILRPGDAREYGARRELLVVKAEALHHRLDHGLLVALVVDDELLGVADLLEAQAGRASPRESAMLRYRGEGRARRKNETSR